MIELQSVAPLGFALVRVAKAHRRWVSGELERLGLHVGQELLLMQLCGREGVRQTDLAEALDIEGPTVHKTLSRLEAAGFVERRADPSDARASLAYLTPRGRNTCARIVEIWREADHRLGAGLSAPDAEELGRLLSGLRTRFDPT